MANQGKFIRNADGSVNFEINDEKYSQSVERVASSGKTEEELTVTADFSDGDQVITPDEGKTLSQVTVEKPSTLIDSNIKNGIEIAGITGSYVGGGITPETKTVTLDLSLGDQTVLPTSASYLMEEVTITKPATLVDSNIKKDVNIAGVVGTYEAPTPTGNINITDTQVTDVSSYATAQVVDANLVAGNIKDNVTILGVTGNYQGGGGGTDNLVKRISNAGNYTYTIPNGITSLKVYGFYRDSNITSINFNEATDIPESFCQSSGITSISGNSVTTISGQNAFSWSSSLTTVNFPSLTQITGNNAFSNCTSLSSFDFSKITSLSYGAFIKTAITSVVSNTITSIDGYTFQNCTSLTTVNLPNVTSLGGATGYSFDGCSNLSSVNLPSLTTLGGGSVFKNNVKLTSISLPELTSNVQNATFSGCSTLASVDLPKTTSLDNSAFDYCRALTSINIPKVTKISNSAFRYCDSLTSIQLPKVTNIQANAFQSCTHLDDIYLGESQVCTLAATSGIPATSSHHITIHVPNDLITSYQTASNWSTLYNNGYITFVAIA